MIESGDCATLADPRNLHVAGIARPGLRIVVLGGEVNGALRRSIALQTNAGKLMSI